MLKVLPQSGTIMPNEIQVSTYSSHYDSSKNIYFPINSLQSHSWKFTPADAKPYDLKVVLHTCFQAVVQGDSEVVSSPKKMRNLLHVMGSGVSGEIKVSVEDSKGKQPLRNSYSDLYTSVHPVSDGLWYSCLLYTSPSPRDATLSRMPSSA